MKDRKVWKLLVLLSDPERKRLRKWLVSELEGRQQYVKRLCHLLLDCFPSAPEVEQIWMNLYPDRPYDDSRLRKLSRDLSVWIERFLTLRNLEKNPELQKSLLLKEIGQRQDATLTIKYIRRRKAELEKSSIRSHEYYKARYELEVEQQRYLIKYTRKQKGYNEHLQASLQHIQHAFDKWWIGERLQLATFGRSPRTADASSSWILMEEMLETIAGHPHLQHDLRLQVYRQLYLLMHARPEWEAAALTRRIREAETAFHREEIQNIHTLLLNHYIRKLNQRGEVRVANVILQLFEWAIEERFIFVDGYLPEIAYKNLIIICIRVRNFERAWHYLHEFKGLLLPERREDIYCLNLGYYYFAKGQYTQVIETYADKRFEDPFAETDARAYLLQTHYELHPEESSYWLLGQIENLIRFVSHQKAFPALHKQSYINRFRLFKRLISAYTDKELAKVERAIQKAHPIDNPQWLIQKVREKRERK